ncbi:MAG: hypothetical protein ACJ79H_10040 [Myxococcales bacterium]
MSGKSVTAYVIVAAILLWWIFGRRVTATVTVPQDEIKIRIPTATRPPNVGDTSGADTWDPGFVDSLPMDGGADPSAEVVNPLEPPRFEGA